MSGSFLPSNRHKLGLLPLPHHLLAKIELLDNLERTHPIHLLVLKLGDSDDVSESLRRNGLQQLLEVGQTTSSTVDNPTLIAVRAALAVGFSVDKSGNICGNNLGTIRASTRRLAGFRCSQIHISN